MLGKNYNYRWYSLSDDVGKIKKMALQQVNKNPAIRWNAYSFANTHWSVIWPRLAESRLFSFEGRIHEIDPSIREQRRAELCRVFKIEWNTNNQLFYPLTRETKYGVTRTSNVMVYTPLQATNDVCNPVIDFNFELVSPDPRIYDPQQITVTGWIGQMWVWPLWHILPYEESSTIGWWIECYHDGDRDAPVSIRVQGTVVNPKVFIIKNNQIKYQLKIKKTTTDLIIDNTNTVAINANDRFVLTDNGVSIREFRDINQWGTPLFIPPTEFWWSPVSYVLVTADNYMEAKDSTVVTVSYRNTYSN